MNVLLIGAGALGKLIAAQLARSGTKIQVLVRREEQMKAIRERGVCVNHNNTTYTQKLEVFTEISDLTPDVVILTVKSYQTEEAAKQITRLCNSPTVLSLQNGLGNEIPLAKYCSKDRIMLGVCTHGVTALSDTTVAWNGVGEILIGSKRHTLAPSVERLVRLLSAAGLHARCSQHIEEDVWRKVLVNCAINPLTAVTRLKNGDLLEREDLLRIMRDVVDEAVRIAEAKGIKVGEIWPRVLDVCRKTAENRSSMLQDLEANRPTEIDALNGAIVKLAEEMSYPVPVNRTLVSLVRTLSSKEVI
ncbi:2-dehydropantoate 2-reductase [Collibacillus ludicampi]|uniref:2-dehydropantoate 2-reductase n=2 Tax=Collibacillus ludicampi TaxID=2771369 RepID=A0AAV4LJ67_9BACL|nr:2-dehydropantoate 2-reductase [Collibacillus ludicampi]